MELQNGLRRSRNHRILCSPNAYVDRAFSMTGTGVWKSIRNVYWITANKIYRLEGIPG